jgi:hypothetical protein
MPALTSGDAERLLRFVAEAESLGGDQPFTSDLLGELGRLVPAEVVAYNELDRVRRRDLLLVVWPDEEDVEFEDDVIWRVILEEHPLCLQQREGRFDAMKLSDFLTQREPRDVGLRQLVPAPRYRAPARGRDSFTGGFRPIA